MKIAIVIVLLIGAAAAGGVMFFAPASKKSEPVATITAPPPPRDNFPADWYYPNRHPKLVGLEGNAAPDIRVKDWIGTPTTIKDLKGKVVVIDFWATWCGPCVRSIPHNVEMTQRLDAKDFAFVGIHESNRGFQNMPKVAQDRKINYPLAIDVGNSTVTSYGVSFFPTYVVIDRAGNVRAAGLRPESVDAVVNKLLAEPVSGG